MAVVLTTLNAKYTHSSLALRYLKEYCDGVSLIKVKEFSINHHLLEILSQIYAEKPQIVGFACYIWNIEMTMKLVNLLKKVLPDVKIICGGPEVSYQPETFFQQGTGIDYIVQGEGEETLRQLLLLLKREKSVALPSVTYQDAQKGLVRGQAAVIEALDNIPFPYHDEEMNALKDKIIYYESSRGCPFSCQYCLSSATKGVRFFPINRVLEELQFFIRHQVRQVKFVDRTFNAKKSHYLPILEFLAEQDCVTNFHFEIAADLLDEEVLAVLKTMPPGRVQLEIGIQSTNQETLKKIQRTNQWDKIVYYVTKLLSFDTIHLHLDLIIGLPHEDYASFQHSFNEVYQLKPHMLQIGFLKLLKGAGITHNCAEHGYVFMDSAPYEVLSNVYISYEKIRILHILEEIFEQYYNSGRFRNSTQYLINLSNGNAFQFYEALTMYWQEQNLHIVAHTTKSLYRYLYEFCQQKYSEEAKVLKEVLKFDALLSDKGSHRPEFLDWNADKFYENTTAFWRENSATKYLAGYVFTSWREIKKQYHIEVFRFDILTFIETGQIHRIEQPVLFSFAGRKVEYQAIEKEDFERR